MNLKFLYFSFSLFLITKPLTKPLTLFLKKQMVVIHTVCLVKAFGNLLAIAFHCQV